MFRPVFFWLKTCTIEQRLGGFLQADFCPQKLFGAARTGPIET